LTNYPKQWEIFPLETLVDVLDNLRVPVNASERSKRLGSVPYYGATGQVGTIDEAIFNEELLVLGEDGVQFFDQNKPKAYKITGPAWVNNHAHVLRPKKDRVLQNFLLHFLNQFNYAGYANGTTRLKLTQGAMNRIPVPLPSIKEQIKIVELLENHISSLDSTLDDIRKINLKSVQFRRSLLQHLFTKNLKNDETAPKSHWQTKKLGEVADTQLGKMLNKSKQTGKNSRLYLRSLNVQWGRIDTSDLNEMDFFPEEMEKFMAKKGDLLICEGGDSGRAAIWDKDESIGFQNALHRVRAKGEVTNKYLFYYIEWLVKNKRIEHLFNGVTIKHFPQEKLRTVEISYPTIDEQNRIIELIERDFSRLDVTMKLVEVLESQLLNFRRSLLQAAFTGRLAKGV
jgi:type I restriction enzyme S subunit